LIKLKQVTTELGKTTLTFEVDFPDSSVRTVEIDYEEIKERLVKVKNLLGTVSREHFKNVVKTLIDELRQGKQPFPEQIDFAKYIDIDLEAEQ